MRKATVWLWVCYWSMAGCSSDFDEGYEPVPEEAVIVLSASNELHIDKSLVFFFRKFQEGDTLVYQTEIEGPTEEKNKFSFELPAGYYQMVLIGNGEADHIVIPSDRSSAGTYINYPDGIEPPELYYGSGLINVGDKKQGGAAILPLTAQITLTIEDIPVGVDRLEVDLKNTDTRIYFNLTRDYLATTPCITKRIDDVKAGTYPRIHFNCLPTAPENAKSVLEVRCYDEDDKLVYRGQSTSFFMGGMENITLSCSFEDREEKELFLFGDEKMSVSFLSDFRLQSVAIK